jgi:AraC family transcriptional regulator of adaptative response/methylated-DNA-[protein]-cysteine methyltransferase
MNYPAETTTSPAPAARETRDYDRIARAIEFLRANSARQPDLAAAARHVHLSEYHFQRLFTRWAGVSPKRFLQYLTVHQAKARIVRSGITDILDDTGLSGAGRLHDLFTSIEAVSPGEYRRAGAGLTVTFGVHETPFGDCVVGTTARGVCCMRFSPRPQQAAAILRADWPEAILVRDDMSTRDLVSRIFEPFANGHRAPLALLVKGTNFQIQVWRALLAIPLGRLTTYSALGREIGHPNAARAIGNAVGANPIAWLIPCHRVIRESGEFGNYRWGEARKAVMLGWEAAQHETAVPAMCESDSVERSKGGVGG